MEGKESIGKKNFYVFLSCSLIVLALGIIHFLVIPNVVTNARLERAAMEARRHDLPDGYIFEDQEDWWGNEIVVSRKHNEDRTAIFYTAISPGKDCSLNTSDDKSVEKIDYNKSKIIGKWAGEKAVQVAKGWKEGIVKKSKHDND